MKIKKMKKIEIELGLNMKYCMTCQELKLLGIDFGWDNDCIPFGFICSGCLAKPEDVFEKQRRARQNMGIINENLKQINLDITEKFRLVNEFINETFFKMSSKCKIMDETFDEATKKMKENEVKE